jgi:cytochrome c-type biogenesis protein CcmF
MIAQLGYFTLWLSLLAAVYAVVASLYGGRTRNQQWVISARNAVYVSFGALALSTGLLQYGIMTQEYQIAYVWSVSSPDMPTFFRWTALWGSQAGSLLFWSFTMGLFSALAVWLNFRSQRRLMPYLIAYMMAVTIFFIGLTLFLENPFTQWWVDAQGDVIEAVVPPADAQAPVEARLAETAQGLNPLLRHFGMAIHPPMLYLGFVGFIVPYAFAMAALASGDLSNNWLKASRRWTLVAWLFLTLGLVLGGRWAYDVLGWGGYWGWDPVENAALLPWLMGTAFLHSTMIQEKRGMLKTWNMVLVIGTFSAVIFGTFATRSGLVDSVHSFARSGIGFPMFTFWAGLTLISVVLILWRRDQGLLSDERPFANLLSRETLFVINNLVFLGLFIVVFWGSFGAPILSELVMDTDITLGVEYFNQVTVPLFIILYILMGVAPLSAWGGTSAARLGKALAIPAGLTIVSIGLFYASGMTNAGALFGYGVVLLAGYVAIYETYRGLRARRRIHDESIFGSLKALYGRNPRRYGGYLIHLGVTIIGIGVIGSSLFQMETQETLEIGDSAYIGGYEMRYDRLDARQLTDDGRITDIATVTVLRNSHELAELRPRRDYFPRNQQSMTIAGAHSTLENDFYVLLVGWEEISQSSVTFKIYINPLINLIWWGSLMLIVGTMVAGWADVTMPDRSLSKSKNSELT